MDSDYPSGRGRVRVEAAGIEIEGVSVAGHESFYKLPGFRVLLEFGRAPEDTVSYATIFLSHGHLDHAAGLAHHASRRRLAGLPAARVFLPEPAIEDVRQWLAASERLEAVTYGVELRPARPGESIPLRRDLEVRCLPGRHRVPSVGYLLNDVRHKLRDEFAGRPGAEIASLRVRGIEVTRREETPLLAYPGDCGAEIFEAAPELFSARVLLIECSFLLSEDVERARRYGHLHLQDFLEREDLFRNEAIVLTHFSQRYLPHEIRRALEGLPPGLAGRVIPFLPTDPG
ncbi:MAG TPA: MBL fold metallo-hydrolase [Thermoanaerobaculia bacterium]